MSKVKLEDLEIYGYMIYQDKDSFNFGIDAVLLANFALREYYGGRMISAPTKVQEDGGRIISTPASERLISSPIRVCDFCTGTLPIPLIMYAKRNLLVGSSENVGAKQCESSIKIDAFEIDEDQVKLCNESILYNKENVEDAKNIDRDINIICDDLKNIFNDKNKYKALYESFDMITCNPPYIKSGSGIKNINDKKIIARHEVLITFEEICKAASLILKSNKKFYIVHHSERFTELSDILKSYSFEIKKVQFIYPRIDKQSTLCLIEAVKNAKSGLKVLEPIIIFENDGNYTEKVKNIYGK